jgi:hypothetical protein
MKDRKQQIRKRRRTALTAGLMAMLGTAVMAIVVASGCIFDEGNYQGGGRRTGTPTASDTSGGEEPSPPSTSTSTSTSKPPDAGQPSIPDTGIPGS